MRTPFRDANMYRKPRKPLCFHGLAYDNIPKPLFSSTLLCVWLWKHKVFMLHVFILMHLGHRWSVHIYPSWTSFTGVESVAALVLEVSVYLAPWGATQFPSIRNPPSFARHGIRTACQRRRHSLGSSTRRHWCCSPHWRIHHCHIFADLAAPAGAGSARPAVQATMGSSSYGLAESAARFGQNRRSLCVIH